MSYFSNSLEKQIRAWGKATEFAAACGVNQGTISRLQNDKTSPDPDTLGRICSILSENEASELVYAYVQDAIPQDLRHLIHCEALGTSKKTRSPSPFKMLSRDKQEAFEKMAQLCLEDQALADLFLRMVERFSGSTK